MFYNQTPINGETKIQGIARFAQDRRADAAAFNGIVSNGISDYGSSLAKGYGADIKRAIDAGISPLQGGVTNEQYDEYLRYLQKLWKNGNQLAEWQINLLKNNNQGY